MVDSNSSWCFIANISRYCEGTALDLVGLKDSPPRCYNYGWEKLLPSSIMKVEPMKISRYFLFLIFVSAMLGCQKDNTTAVGTRATVNDINAASPETAANAASPETAAVEFVIDVRTQEEWDKGHLKQAIRIPHTEVSERIGEVTEDKSAKLVLY